VDETLKRREAQTEERLKRLEDKAIADIRVYAADLAMNATVELIGKTMDERTGQKLSDQSIKSLPRHLN